MPKLGRRIYVRGYYTWVTADTEEQLAEEERRAKRTSMSDFPQTDEDEIDHRRNRRKFEGYDW